MIKQVTHSKNRTDNKYSFINMLLPFFSCSLFLLFFTLSFPSVSQNLITNGDFETGVSGWSNMAGGTGVATFTCPITGAANVHTGINALRSNVTTAGANAWDVQTVQSGFTATIGIAHTLTFWAKATIAGRQMRIVVQNSSYAAQDYTLTTAWAQYSFIFTPSETSLQLKIHYTQSGDFYFDDFSIPDVSGGPSPVTSTLTASTTYQQMVGFGGALTWYADRIISSPNKTAICDLMFTDSGLDILRLKNWYYPLNYPTNKTTATMDPAGNKLNFDVANQIHTLAKARNSNIDVLLCSWSPPKALKSNNDLPLGTLKQTAGQFMYKELAQYWVDILDNISFTPEYISMQNEPGFVTSGWETCEWRPTETGGFPGYDRALDSLWLHIKNRPNVPKVLGPEPENLGTAVWNSAVNTFRDMSTPIKTKPYLYGYAYHLYNYGGGAGSISPTNLNMIRDEFGNHPNFMTEFSSTNYNWIDVARMVHANVTEANTSAYIYWELGWDAASTSAMIGLDAAGGYTVKDNYYSIKHFAKYIDKGYTRIAATGSNATLNISAFRNPAGNQITVVVINNHVSTQPLTIALSGATMLSAVAYQSVAGNYWQNLGTVNLSTVQNLPSKSLTTYVINTSSLPVKLLNFDAIRENTDAFITWNTLSESDNDHFDIMHSSDGSSFENIGSIKGMGNSDKVLSYHFLHKNINADKHYYQLKQTDKSGTSELSTIIELASSKEEISPSVFPNPFNDELTLCSDNSWKGAEVNVYNTQGTVIYKGRIEENLMKISTVLYPSGFYMARIQSGEKFLILKTVKE
jgi:hypothetical protein